MHKPLSTNCFGDGGAKHLWAGEEGVKSIEETLSALAAVLMSNGLSNLQKPIARNCEQRQTYTQITEITGYDDG